MKNNDSSAVVELLKKKLPDLASRECVYGVLGIYTPGTLANLDCTNSGIGGRIRLGRKIFYPKNEVIKFIAARMIVEG